jgi:hypothetical protein
VQSEKTDHEDNTGKYKSAFKENDLEIFETVAGNVLEELGYALHSKVTAENRDSYTELLLSEEKIKQYSDINAQLKKETLLQAPAPILKTGCRRKRSSKKLNKKNGYRERMFIEIEPLLTVAVKAGEAILSIYNDVSVSGSVQYKADKSPLTLADTLSHNRIVADLKLLHPDIPILSEEGADIPYEVRKTWEYYWCVDPLDGTKEFINRNGEFTGEHSAYT